MRTHFITAPDIITMARVGMSDQAFCMAMAIVAKLSSSDATVVAVVRATARAARRHAPTRRRARRRARRALRVHQRPGLRHVQIYLPILHAVPPPHAGTYLPTPYA